MYRSTRCYCSTAWMAVLIIFFFFQAEDGIRDDLVTGVQTCALPILADGKGAHQYDLVGQRRRRYQHECCFTAPDADQDAANLIIDRHRFIAVSRFAVRRPKATSTRCPDRKSVV